MHGRRSYRSLALLTGCCGSFSTLYDWQ